MGEVTFRGYLVVPNTDIKPIQITPNVGDQLIEVEDRDIVIHAIYVSNPNPVMAKVTIKPLIVPAGRNLEFRGTFGNDTKPLPFMPPIGPFKQGKVIINVEAPGAEDNITINIQYSEVGEESG